MIVTEAEACELHCCGSPAARQGRPGSMGAIVWCSASQCMAWDWEDPEFECPEFKKFNEYGKAFITERDFSYPLEDSAKEEIRAYQDIYWKAEGYSIDERITAHTSTNRYSRPRLDNRRGGCGLVNLHVDVEVNN